MKKRNILISKCYKFIGIISVLFALVVSMNLFIGEIMPIEASASHYIDIVVEPGDTLWNIAKKYHNGKNDIRNYIEEIKKVNELKNSNILVDQKLFIPIR